MPAAVVDLSNTAQSREFLRLVDASADVRIQSHCTDMEEAKTLLKETKVYGIIYIPADFNKDLSTGKQATVSLFCDMSGMLYYKSLLLACTNASLSVNKQIQIERAGNTTDRQDEITTAPIEYEDISLFNPQDGFASFLIPAVLILIIQQTLLLGIGMSAGTARENNRFRDLIPTSKHYQGTLRVVAGKSFAYLLIYLIVSAYILCLVEDIQSGANRPAVHIAGLHLPIPAGMHLLRHDLLGIHPPPRVVSDDLRIHFRSAAVHIRNFMAGSSHPRILESVFLPVPFHIRHQRICTDQYHGSGTQRSASRIPGIMDPVRSILHHHMPGIPLSGYIKP